jgi:hypothetical protein
MPRIGGAPFMGAPDLFPHDLEVAVGAVCSFRVGERVKLHGDFPSPLAETERIVRGVSVNPSRIAYGSDSTTACASSPKSDLSARAESLQ